MTDTSVTAPWRAAMPWPQPDAHKHDRGRLGVVSGTALHTGAARLAARAGLRIGAGLVRILCPPDAALVIASAIEAVMVDEFMSPEALGRLADPLDAVVIGPAAGLTEATAFNLAALGRTGAALVVDADALTVFKGRPGDLFACLDRDDVLTPHEGEFERVFPGLLAHGRELAAVQASKAMTAMISGSARFQACGASAGNGASISSGLPLSPKTKGMKIRKISGRAAMIRK